MAVVDDVPGFTQIPRLNVSETLAINGIPSGKEVLAATSTAAQVPAGTDAPLQVEFGPAQGTAADPVQTDVAGTLFINQTGTYLFTVLFSVERSSPAGTSILFVRVLLNGQQGNINAIAISETDSASTTPLQYSLVINVKAGDQITTEFYRDSAGNNDGQLVSFTSSIGWGTGPSAVLRVVKV